MSCGLGIGSEQQLAAIEVFFRKVPANFPVLFFNVSRTRNRIRSIKLVGGPPQQTGTLRNKDGRFICPEMLSLKFRIWILVEVRFLYRKPALQLVSDLVLVLSICFYLLAQGKIRRP
jgi:hypothetical protein